MWKSFSEIDIGSMREDAQLTPRLAVIGARDRTTLLEAALQHGPRTEGQTLTALASYRLPLDPATLNNLAQYDLRILLLDNPSELTDEDVQALTTQAVPLFVIIDRPGDDAIVVEPEVSTADHVTVVSALLDDTKAVQKTLLPALANALPDGEVALARAYPGLRPTVVQHMIQRTSMTNAMYAAGTGVAEMVPGLGIPFAVADIIILTKNQLVMAYKIGLSLGETGEFREVIPKMAGVVGAGFMWRQVARELVAFLPLGVVLKTAIAYAGTYATGQAVYQWYVTGEKLDRKELRRIFNDALERGKAEAAGIVARARRQKQSQLNEPPAKQRRRIRLPWKRGQIEAPGTGA